MASVFKAWFSAPASVETDLPASGAWLKAGSLAVLLLIWAVAAYLVDDRLLPTPYAVARSFLEHTLTGDLIINVAITLARVAAAFIVAMAIGTALGLFMGRAKRADMLLDSWLLVFLNIPALVVAVLCYIWFGLTEVAAVTAVAINKIPTAVVVREGARAIRPELLQVGQAYRLLWRKTMTQIYLPQLYPSIMASARSGLALIWKIVLVVELLGRSNGVGFQIAVFFQFFYITSILAYTFAFVAVVMAIELWGVQPLERHLTRWRA